MSISLKAELEIWAAALKAYDEQDFERALELFSGIADSSKILTNMGLIYATIGEHEIAVQHFVAATNLDSYLAIAHFQCGVSNFLVERYDLALLNFEDACLYLRGNEVINYEQIGLKFKLFSAEIMFNKGLTQLNLGHAEEGMADMQEASKQKLTNEHGVIDDAIRDRGEGYTVFSIPVGVLYRPSENKVKNSKAKDYLGKAKLVAASDSNDAFTEFTGVKKLQQTTDHNHSTKDDVKNKDDAELPAPGENTPQSIPLTESVAARRTALARSKTTPQRAAGVRPGVATVLASRRTQSVSNPENTPQVADPSQNDTRRTARSAATSPVVTPLRAKMPQGTAAGVASSASNARAAEEAGAVADGGAVAVQRPSLRRVQGVGTPQVVPLPALQPSSVSIQSSQCVIASRDITPLVLPATPVPTAGHLTQFYDTYMDVYTEDLSRFALPHSPQSHPQRQIQEQDKPLLPAWVALSPVTASGHTNPNTSSPSRAVNARMDHSVGIPAEVAGDTGVHPHTGTGKSNSGAGGRTARRKPSRVPGVCKGMVYEAEDDEGFVAGDYDVLETANLRVKLHYQGDVRGMTMHPTTSFDKFVARVTAKFGTSLMGLGMKFVDEEGTRISLRDESDFELAIETARENAKGKSEGKIEIWCVDL